MVTFDQFNVSLLEEKVLIKKTFLKDLKVKSFQLEKLNY